ncbi:MAG: hypothetical protein HC836_27690 [Richelia sp. RM2_1_2]|nr:hypothetical protein [Richelia sp. RM2_1_2]
MRFRLLGLVVKEDRIIKVYNRIYKSVFNSSWVEKELGKLRPYAESFQAWVNSDYQDESRLLRGQALQDALHWANEKNLSNQDARYLGASQELEKAELAAALATQEEEGRILAQANEELRQSQHKSELANQTLKQAQKKSRRMIRFGAGFLIVTIALAIVATTVIQIQSKNTLIARLEETATILLRVPKEFLSIESLSDGIRTAREWKNLVKNNYPISSPTSNLQNVLLNIRERNRLEAHEDLVYSVAFSPDGKTLASGSLDNTIKLWDIGSSKLLTTLSAHQDSVYSVAFSPDGKTLASGSGDNTIKLWNLDLDDLLAKGCEYLQEYLMTREEERKELCPRE